MPKLIFSLILLIINISANAVQLNVYLRYDECLLREKISHFNQFLAQHDFFTHHKITPFLDKFPLHTSLYLADFKNAAINELIDKVDAHAKQFKLFSINTSNFIVTSGNYLMLNVKLAKDENSLNHPLQGFCDQLALDLHTLRDPFAKIPDWALTIPSKKAAFKRYGSPNVFFEFSPHFTLMAKKFTDKRKAKRFVHELQTLIDLYVRRYDNQVLELSPSAIAIGYVDEYGQIIKEIHSIKLIASPKP
jgi:hypothetical protein